MKPLLQFLFAIAFASSLSILGAPLFDDRRHETFSRSVSKWIKIVKGPKSNGLQKFSALTVSVWASSIEKGIEKISKELGVTTPKVVRVGSDYHLLVSC